MPLLPLSGNKLPTGVNNMRCLLAPSLLAANPANLAADVAAAERGGAEWLHLDIMDGHFVPNLSFGPHISAGISKVSRLPIDVHLMVEKPSMFVAPFIKAGAAGINVHVEAEDPESLINILAEVRGRGLRPAIALKPKTPISEALPYLSYIDMVLLMTVEPGYGGQGFLPGSLERIAAMRGIISNRGIDLQIDGGVTLENTPDCIKSGANILVAGSSVFGAPDIAGRVTEFIALFPSEGFV